MFTPLLQFDIVATFLKTKDEKDPIQFSHANGMRVKMGKRGKLMTTGT